METATQDAIPVHHEHPPEPKPTVSQILDLIQSLTVEEKVEIISKILGSESGLSVILGSHQNINVGTNIHVNMLTPEQAAEILKLIANMLHNKNL